METSDKVVPSSTDEVSRMVSQAGVAGRALRVARSGMTYSLKRRVGIFAIDDRPELLVDTFIAAGDYDGLVEALAGGPAGWDVQYATSWNWVWWTDEGTLNVVSRIDGCIARANAYVLVVGDEQAAVSTLSEVELWTDFDMVQRRLRAVGRDGTSAILYAEDDDTPLYDPGYDLTMLDAETTWLQDLGAAAATAMGLNFVTRLRAG